MITKTQVKIILILLDNAGYAEWQIAQMLRMEESNLNRILGILVKMGTIYKGKSRISKRPHKKKGNYSEVPYYLKRDLKALKRIIRALIESERTEIWFILSLIWKSEFLESMRTKFGNDANLAVQDELKQDPIFSDTFYANLINQGTFLDPTTVHACAVSSPSVKKEERGEIRKWYEENYLFKMEHFYPEESKLKFMNSE